MAVPNRARRLSRFGFIQSLSALTVASYGWLRAAVTGGGLSARKRSTKNKVKLKSSQGRWP